jgi:predicted aspartyl protease
MGRIEHHITLINAADILAVGMNLKPATEIRSVALDMLVDTGAAMICLPSATIQHLGLLYNETMSVRTANGIAERKIFSPVRVEVLGRNAMVEVLENDDMTPPLLGYLALEKMDLQVNMKDHTLIANPAYNGKWLVDLL